MKMADTAAAVVKGQGLFVVGGSGTSAASPHPLARPATFLLKEGERVWTEGPKLTLARAGHCLVAVGARLYALGGFDNNARDPEAVSRSIEVRHLSLVL